MALRSLSLGSVSPCVLGASALLLCSQAQAAPVLRYQADLRGDVVVFGSTLTYDCGSSVAAPAGTEASCDGQSDIEDTAGDLYWRDDIANASIAPSQARTSATLSLPDGATVKYARLYWSALKVGDEPDRSVVLDWKYGAQTDITADACHDVIPYPWSTHSDWFYYQCSGDVTDYVSGLGAGDFRVSGVDAIDLANESVHVAYSAWTLVVFYENPSEDMRNLALFDGFEFADPEHGHPSVEAPLSGFLVPSGFTAKMAAFMYEGDNSVSGDHFSMNGHPVSNAQNPEDNFFNSSRTQFGVPFSGELDVPRFTGEANSMAGYDLDVVDVTSLVHANDTSATVGADSSEDKFILGGFVTSITSKAPDFTSMTKQVQDINGGGVLAGDILEYTIRAQNTGNDDAINASLTDHLEPGLEFVPGSIHIISGGATGAKTDEAGDDEAEYVAGDRLVVVRVGQGATAFSGGTVPVQGSVEVRFRAKVTINTGTVANKAILTASGESGGLEHSYESDGDPNQLGQQSTDVTVNECSSDGDCHGNKPHCDTATHTCVGCHSDADCTDPAHPACQPTGACGQCSQSNHSLCRGNTPVCNTSEGLCVLCTLGPQGDATQCAQSPDGPVCVSGPSHSVFCGCTTDPDCGSGFSGRVCDTTVQKCIDGCRGRGGNGCPTELQCTSHDSTIGHCVTASDADGGAEASSPEPGADAEVPSPSVTTGQSGEDGGCACSTPSSPRSSSFAAALVSLLAAALLRRRRSA